MLGNSKKKVREMSEWLVVLCTAAMILAAGLLARLQLDAYEEGMIEAYADQQDDCVQLVLDRINLIDGANCGEEVRELVSSLDCSSGRYWVLSSGGMIMAADPQLADRCKDLTTTEYFASESAAEFIRGLALNRTAHGTIRLNNASYAASGARFECGGVEYSLCLLTSFAEILDRNACLNAKSNLCVLFAAIIVAFLACGIALSVSAQNGSKRLAAAEEENVRLRSQIERLTALFSRQEHCSARYNVICEDAVDMLAEKLEKRDVWPLSCIIVKCGSYEQRSLLLLEARELCGKRSICALAGNNNVLIFSVRSDEASVSAVQRAARNSGAAVAGCKVFPAKPDIPLKEDIERFKTSVLSDGTRDGLALRQAKLKQALMIEDENKSKGADKAAPCE